MGSDISLFDLRRSIFHIYSRMGRIKSCGAAFTLSEIRKSIHP